MNYTKSDHIRWNNMYELLISYKKKHGNCLVPTTHKEGDRKLGHWVRNQRYNYKNNELSNYRINKLKLVGFVFYSEEARWKDMFHRLVLYKQKYGNCLIPNPYKEDPKLANWVTYQKWCYNNNKLSNDYIDKLKSIGFVFHHRHSSTETQTPSSPISTTTRRTINWNNRHQRLKSIHFDCLGGKRRKSSCDAQWNNMYQKLISYKEIHGNCLVPTQYQEDTKLANWVNTQKANYKKNKLSNDRFDKLKSIGFLFFNARPLWDEMFDRLLLYKQRHGNCWVPCRYKEDKELGYWAQSLRRSYKHNTLSNDQIDKLKSVGFVFDYDAMKWNDMFNRLVSYKQKYGNFKVPTNYGNCFVPTKCKKYTKLGDWVHEQRWYYKNKKLSNDRIDKLKSIDFVFELRNMSDRNIENNNIKSSLGQKHEIVKTVAETRTGTTTPIRSYGRRNADVKEGEEETMTYGSSSSSDDNNISRLSATSSVLNSNVSSIWNLSAVSNDSGCDDNDSVFADAEEDIDGSWGYLTPGGSSPMQSPRADNDDEMSMEHHDDADIDEMFPTGITAMKRPAAANVGGGASCGKRLRRPAENENTEQVLAGANSLPPAHPPHPAMMGGGVVLHTDKVKKLEFWLKGSGSDSDGEKNNNGSTNTGGEIICGIMKHIKDISDGDIKFYSKMLLDIGLEPDSKEILIPHLEIDDLKFMKSLHRRFFYSIVKDLYPKQPNLSLSSFKIKAQNPNIGSVVAAATEQKNNGVENKEKKDSNGD